MQVRLRLELDDGRDRLLRLEPEVGDGLPRRDDGQGDEPGEQLPRPRPGGDDDGLRLDPAGGGVERVEREHLRLRQDAELPRECLQRQVGAHVAGILLEHGLEPVGDTEREPPADVLRIEHRPGNAALVERVG